MQFIRRFHPVLNVLRTKYFDNTVLTESTNRIKVKIEMFSKLFFKTFLLVMMVTLNENFGTLMDMELWNMSVTLIVSNPLSLPCQVRKSKFSVFKHSKKGARIFILFDVISNYKISLFYKNKPYKVK